jgi:hypothetical protein
MKNLLLASAALVCVVITPSLAATPNEGIRMPDISNVPANMQMLADKGGGGHDDGADHDSGDDHGGNANDDNDNDDDDANDDNGGGNDNSGGRRPRVPGGSGCDNAGDIAEHGGCTAG